MERLVLGFIWLLLVAAGTMAGCGGGTQRPDTGTPADDDDAGDDDDDATGDDDAADDDTALGTPLTRVDVLIVGAGASGMAAATECRDQGIDVLVVEQNGAPTDFLYKMALFSGSGEQAEAGVVDSPELLLSEWPDITGGDPEDPWVNQFAQRNVVDVRDWLAERDIRFMLTDSVIQDAGSVRRLHILQAAVEPAEQSSLARSLTEADVIRFYTYVTELVVEDGSVIGVRYQDLTDGSEGWIEARRTIVTTGGFLRNLTLVHQVRPELADVELWFGCVYTATGSGHLMLAGAGATLKNARAIGLYANGYPDPGASGRALVDQIVRAGIWVNTEGERFTNEAIENSFEPGEQIVTQPDGIAWLVVDQRRIETLAPWDAMNMVELELAVEDLIDGGWAFAGDTFGELAAEAGIDPDGLEQSAAQWALYVAGEVEDPFQDIGDIPPHSLNQPPYYAIRLAPTLAKAFGGVNVDSDGRVVDDTGQVIPGVLAAGELTGMAGGSLVGDSGFTGSISAVILGGRIAGQTASAEILADP